MCTCAGARRDPPPRRRHGFRPAVEGRPPTPAGTVLREQTLQALANVEAVLEEGGASWDDVMMVRPYLTDVDHFAEMNEIYDRYFEEQSLTGPARGPYDGVRRPSRRTPGRIEALAVLR